MKTSCFCGIMFVECAGRYMDRRFLGRFASEVDMVFVEGVFVSRPPRKGSYAQT